MDGPYFAAYFTEAASEESARLELSAVSFAQALLHLLVQTDRTPSALQALSAPARASAVFRLSCAALSSQSTASTR